MILAGGRRTEMYVVRIEESENALKSQLAFREGIVECAAEGVCVCHGVPDPPFVRFTVWNRRMTEMTGYTMEEINRFGWYQSLYPDPDLQARAIARMDRMRQGIDLKGEEWEITRSDGETRILAMSTSILQSEEGTVHVLALMQDVTDRKRVEEALRVSEEKFRVLSDQSPLGMTLIDGKGRYEYVNPAFEKMFGYTLQDLSIGKDWFRAAFPEPGNRKEVVRIWKEDLIAAGIGVCRPRIFEVACRGGDRKTILFRPVSLLGNRQLVIYEDITERQRLEAQLRQAMKMEAVGRLSGGVAHDFNNLLTVIIGNVSLAQGKVQASDPVSGMLLEVNKAAERAARLTQQLLAFSRKQIIEPKVLDLNALIADLHSMLVRLIGEHIEIATGLGEGLGTVRVDPGQLEQILVNLAVNARDAMREGGKLRIETSNVELDEAYCAVHPDARPGWYVRLSVSDTGHGMTEEVRAQIFEPFFTTKPKGSGTGLGLSMTYGAVKQAGGSIDVLSEPEKGTTVRIYLPRVETEAEKGQEPGEPQELLDGTETVLLVEDEDVVRGLCVQVLERLGYNVLQAGNGAEAIALAREFGGRIDLLLTDVVMPGMNGGELATHLVILHPEAKVLFTSGYTDDAIVQHGVLDDGVFFIGKPYTPTALAKKVRDVLDRK
ncbi:MAG: PAS domain S-box protein [Deltaproteobacteria bacterium]|nr:PAS domain S-box protein [Deltaproteobacteria bacterium]